MSEEIAHIVQLVLIPMLGVVGFVGIRIFKSIDRLFVKIDEYRMEFDRRFNDANARVSLHAERITRLEAFHALDIHKKITQNGENDL